MRKTRNGEKWFWTPEWLTELVSVLDEMAQEDAQGWYFGPEGLATPAKHELDNRGMDVAQTNVVLGIRILSFLGGLEEGRRGAKPSNYKRRYYPDNIRVITWDDINRFREAHIR